MFKQIELVSALHNSALGAARAHFEELGLMEISLPVLVGITGACENISTLFKLQGNSSIHLTQAGQLALEQALQINPGVCCISKSFRMDHIDEHHLNEFTLIEEEVSWIHPSTGKATEPYCEDAMFDVLLDRITLTIRAIISTLVKENAALLEKVGAPLERLSAALIAPFTRISYTSAVELLKKTGKFKTLEWGQDLNSEHERELIEIVSKPLRYELPIFITHYPERIKFFNMKVSPNDARVVNNADLLLPKVGKAAGSAVREHNYEKLLERLTSSVMFAHIQEQGMATLDDFRPYLDVIRNHPLPHAGYSIGLERVIQYILGQKDIRQASVTYLLSELTGFNKHLDEMQRAAGTQTAKRTREILEC